MLGQNAAYPTPVAQGVQPQPMPMQPGYGAPG